MNLIQGAHAALTTTDFNGINVVTANVSNLSLQGIAVKVVGFILIVAAIIAVIYLLYSGILYLTAAGNEANADKGRKGIVNAVIGIIIIVLAFVILRVTQNAAQNAVT